MGKKNTFTKKSEHTRTIKYMEMFQPISLSLLPLNTHRTCVCIVPLTKRMMAFDEAVGTVRQEHYTQRSD